jgi:hypothetical protein
LRVSLFDATTKLIAPDSAVAFNNQVYGYTSQGIAAISDSGVAIMSRPVEDDLQKLSAVQYVNFKAVTFGVSYESDRKYIFATVTGTADTYATRQFVYNSVTNTFTEWDLPMIHAVVNDADDKLYYCDAVLGHVMKERKSFTVFDYADDDLLLQITGQNGLTVEVVTSAGVEVGWTFSDGTRTSIVTAVPDPTHITVRDLYTWPFGPASVYKPIRCVVKWAPIHAGNPAILKHFTDILMHFRDATFDTLALTFNSDMSGYDETHEVTPRPAGAWGWFPWGSPAWGGQEVYLQTIRTLTPLNKARCRWLNFQVEHQRALANFAIAGVAFNYAPLSLRSR